MMGGSKTSFVAANFIILTFGFKTVGPFLALPIPPVFGVLYSCSGAGCDPLLDMFIISKALTFIQPFICLTVSLKRVGIDLI